MAVEVIPYSKIDLMEMLNDARHDAARKAEEIKDANREILELKQKLKEAERNNINRYFNIALRMCDADEMCERGNDSCVFSGLDAWCKVFATDTDTTFEVLRGLEDWEAKHPIPLYPTWEEWAGKTFPKGVPIDFCPRSAHKGWKCMGEYHCIECVRSQIPSEIAKELGVEENKHV